MPGTMQQSILISSALCFLAVFLGVRWIGPAWDKISRRYVADLTPRLRALGMSGAQIDRYMRWWGIAVVATFSVFAFVLAMIPVAVGLTYLVIIAPRYLLDYQISRRRILLRDQMVRATMALANSVRAGLSLAQGLEVVSRDTPEPLATEFRRIVHEYNSGRPLAESLIEVQQRLDLEVFDIFCSAVLVCMERGGRVSVALDRIGANIQELQRLERKLEADTASGRRLTLVLGAFPLFFLAGFTLLDPVAMGYLYTTQVGQLVLLAVGVMVYFSVRWCSWILKVDF